MLANALGQFISETRYETLPAPVVQAVKIRVLDLLAAGMAGFRLGHHNPLLRIVTGSGHSSVWGIGPCFALRDAALLNSFLAHSTYLEDGSRYTGGHPSSVVIPAALALAEEKRTSGQDVIAAIAVGYELFLRLGRAIYPSTVVRGFQSTAVLGAVAAAASCSNLLRATPKASKDALAIACCLGTGLKEALKSAKSAPLQVARSCEGGILATLFADGGAEGADTIIENGFTKAYAAEADLESVLLDLGTQFRIFETYLKVHGGCRGNHAPIDVVQQLVKNHAVKAGEIERIVIHVDTVTHAADIPEPRTGAQAQFSIPFSVALALLDGAAPVFEFNEARLHDPSIRTLMARIRVEVDPRLDVHYPEKRGAAAEIGLHDGRRYEGFLDNAIGEPERPLSIAEVEGKFLTLTSEVLRSNAHRVRDLVFDLEKLPDVSLIARHLTAYTAGGAIDRNEPRVQRHSNAGMSS